MPDRIPRATDTNGLFVGDLGVGDRVGEYVIERLRATRGPHEYEARHLVLPRRAMIRIIPSAQTLPQSVAIDLLREACIVEAIEHPGVPRVFECGMLGARRPWIAMELVEGPSLAARGELAMREAAAVVRDVADVLGYAHDKGIVHHAINPEAIVFPTGRPFPLCVLDWNGARTRDSLAPLPLPGLARARYAAPERARDHVSAIDGRADIYSLGMITRELLVRTAPEARPPILAALVNRMLSLDPTRRPTAKHVRDHAAWLVDQFELSTDPSIPAFVDEDASTEEIVLASSGAITSDITPEVSGLITRTPGDASGDAGGRARS